jgi:hypothetical protein
MPDKPILADSITGPDAERYDLIHPDGMSGSVLFMFSRSNRPL